MRRMTLLQDWGMLGGVSELQTLHGYPFVGDRRIILSSALLWQGGVSREGL